MVSLWRGGWGWQLRRFSCIIQECSKNDCFHSLPCLWRFLRERFRKAVVLSIHRWNYSPHKVRLLSLWRKRRCPLSVWMTDTKSGSKWSKKEPSSWISPCSTPKTRLSMISWMYCATTKVCKFASIFLFAAWCDGNIRWQDMPPRLARSKAILPGVRITEWHAKFRLLCFWPTNNMKVFSFEDFFQNGWCFLRHIESLLRL